MADTTRTRVYAAALAILVASLATWSAAPGTAGSLPPVPGTKFFFQRGTTSWDLRALHMVPGTTVGWAVGGSGQIIRTSDNGRTWAWQYSGTASRLNGVGFGSPTTGIAVGASGSVVTTTDAGRTWSKRSSRVGAEFLDVHVLSSGWAWAVGSGGVVIRSKNGGSYWTIVRQPGAGRALRAVGFSDANNGWAVGDNGTIIRSTLRGDRWTTQISGTKRHLRDIAVISRQVAYVVGDGGVVLKTINGGANWMRINLGVRTNLRSVSFYGARGWIAGEHGRMYRTADYGRHWRPCYCGLSTELSAARLSSDKNGCVVARFAPVRRTADFGTSWSYGTVQPFTDVALSDASQGWAVGASGCVAKTSNTGATWTRVGAPAVENIAAVDADRTGCVWTVGQRGQIVASYTWGRTWQRQTSPTAAGLTDIDVLTDGSAGSYRDRGWIVGNAGTILRTTDSGWHWTKAPSGTTQDLLGVCFANEYDGWAVGTAGTILRTANGGLSWTRQTSGTQSSLYSVATRGTTEVWVVGLNGTVLRTTNSGQTWTVLPEFTAMGLKSIAIAQSGSSFRLWTSSDQGYAWTSTNGVAWARSGPMNQKLRGISAQWNGNRAWIASESGALLAYDGSDPVATARGNVKAVRGKRARLPFRISDAAPNCGTARVTLRVIQRLQSGGRFRYRVVMKKTLRNVAVNRNLSYSFRCKLARGGAYRYCVTAVDGVGNASPPVPAPYIDKVATGKLVVR